MKEVIQEILDEEKSARERLETARAKARQDTEISQANARQLIETARTEALRESEQIIEKVRTETAREQADLISSANQKCNEVINANQTFIQNAVELLIRKIIADGETQP